MPRPKKAGGPEPKKRSRNGCWPCKARKVKCDEQHPHCLNCQRQGEECDYSIRLNWDGRGKRKDSEPGQGQSTFTLTSNSSPDTQEQHPPTTQFHATPFQNHELLSQTTLGFKQTANVSDASNVSTPRSHGRQEIRPYQQIHPLQRIHHGSPTRATETSPCTSIAQVSSRVDTKAQAHNYYNIPFPPSPSTIAGSSEHDDPKFTGYEDRPWKRARHESASQDGRSPRSFRMPPPNGPSGVGPGASPQHSGSWGLNSQPSGSATPSMDGDSASRYQQLPKFASPSYDAAEDARRKPSIESLLSGPAGMGSESSYTPNRSSMSDHRPSLTESRGSVSDTRGSIGDIRGSFSNPRRSASDVLFQDGLLISAGNALELIPFGLDRGFKDLDVLLNDDATATNGYSPTVPRAQLSPADSSDGSFGFGIEAKTSEFGGDYYANPVPIRLHQSFLPLPSEVSRNPMHILYFHYFISHTARILVPHHCSSNPFQTLLPRMALQDKNLMSLLLAYSAAHRARHLRQNEPVRRIAVWIQDVIPNLRNALGDPTRIVQNTTLATAIMLASLEIISPKSFSEHINWRQHLAIARQLIRLRGGANSMHQDHSEVTHFLLRWFAYLDVIGSLVGGDSTVESGTSWASEYDFIDCEHGSYQIDCLLGFTSHCITILARTSDLARICDRERITSAHSIKSNYSPNLAIRDKASFLLQDVEHSLTHTAIRKCPYIHYDGETVAQWDNLEMTAVNEAYHQAAKVHIQRRVLGKPSDHPDVQVPVQMILSSLYKVRQGSSAEICLLFPMFTAGCDAQGHDVREYLLTRLRRMEECGMSQVQKARRLMERVWNTGKPWETLVAGEFVG